jgi:pimeloyl-ACP methyl ester carboxylesterase
MTLTPQTHRTALLHGHTMSYVEHAGSGIPLVLVHGVGSSLQTWDEIPDRLAATGRHVIAVDLLGHGLSGFGNGDFSLGANANAIRDLLDHLALDRVHLVGHSLGGGVALQFSYQYPDRVDSLTLVASGGLGSDASTGLRAASLPGSELAIRLLTTDRVLAAGDWASRLLDRVGLRTEALSSRSVDRLRALQDDRRKAAFLATLRSVVGPEGQRVSGIDRLGTLDPRRVLIVWGDRDTMIPWQHGLSAHERLRGSRFLLLPWAGHHPHNHDPVAFADAVLAHVRRAENSDAATPD